jgi:hypothetical protein
MAGERNYLRVPPDSTGKRVRLKHSAQLAYTGKTVGYQWKPDNYYTLVTSGWEIHVHEIHETNSTSGFLDVSYDGDPEFTNLTPAAGEGIRDQATNAVIATAGAAIDIYNNTTNIVGFENPTNGLDIDNTGSANIRFYEGNPQLDAFGKLRVSGATLLGEYVFSNGTLPTQFASTLRNGGSVSWDNNSRALVLTNTTANDSHSSHTSHTYHHYFPGSSQLFIGTFALGDTGKMGLMREWGMFDDKNGFYFMQDDGVIGVGIRSNATGTVQDVFIPKTAWNVDRADGTGRSQMVLDVTKDNIYWIDVQWLGAGRARFGTYYEGQRVVLHEYQHGNRFPYPITAMGSLPVCVHQMNMTATGSVSEMRAWCMAVWTESTLDVRNSASTALQSFSKTISVNDTYQYLGTLSPKELLPNGQPNRTLYWPTEIEASGWDTVTGAPAIFELEIYGEPVLANLTWNPVASSTVEYDTGGTFVSSGVPVSKRFVQGRDTFDATTTFNNMQYGAFKNYAEDGGTVVQPITGVTKASTAVVTLAGARTLFRDGEPMTISGVAGMTQLNGNTYYVKPITVNSVELYTDAARTTPVDSTGFGTYTSGGVGSGTFGPKFHFGILVTKLFGTNPIKVYVKVSWKEVTQ